MSQMMGLLAKSEDAVGLVFMAVVLALAVFLIAGMWKTFEKANQPGWGCIVPIYNLVLMLKIAGKPIWWLVLMLIPFINLIPGIIVPIAIAKNFRKSAVFGVGLILLPLIFYPILGFGSAEYDPDVPIF